MLTRLVVKVLYDYAAIIEEKFDFQAEDIIAVTSTPEDGWWTGNFLMKCGTTGAECAPEQFRLPFLVLFVSTFSFFLS